jgi:hypothetical protein
MQAFSGWGNEIVRCHVFDLVAIDSRLFAMKLMESEIVHATVVGGHAKLLERVVRSLDVHFKVIRPLKGNYI